MYVPDATFELVAIEAELEPGRPRESFVATSAPPRAAKGTAPGANLRFDDVERRAYLLRCRKKGLDSAPRLVTAAELKREGDAAAIAEIVVREAFVAGFVLDPPIARGTHVVIESTSGQPLRELHVDEFGVAVTDLFEGAYRLHLVEYGRATGAVDVRVDRNPFVFEIHR
jgi:hypothetical protein